MLALSTRAVWAEAILRKIKMEEQRSRQTWVRGRVWLYSSLTRYPAAVEAELSDELGFDVASLPRGVIVGSVEIVGVREVDEGGFAWALARPRRARKLVAPTRQPLPTFFRPW